MLNLLNFFSRRNLKQIIILWYVGKLVMFDQVYSTNSKNLLFFLSFEGIYESLYKAFLKCALGVRSIKCLSRQGLIRTCTNSDKLPSAIFSPGHEISQTFVIG